jgi:hypothetical protein
MTNAESGPSATPSPQGRRVLVVVVTGAAGERIQQWRVAHDPEQARRIPPHTTLCYWVPPDLDIKALGRQVRYALEEPVGVCLGAVRRFTGGDGSLFIELAAAEGLDAARRRLFDGTFAVVGEASAWPWHVTCVRSPSEERAAELLAPAEELAHLGETSVERVELLELQGDRYVSLASWLAEKARPPDEASRAGEAI